MAEGISKMTALFLYAKCGLLDCWPRIILIEVIVVVRSVSREMPASFLDQSMFVPS